MKNKHYIFSFILVFAYCILCTACLFITQKSIWQKLLDSGVILSYLIGFVLLFRNGTFRKTIFFNIIMFLFAIIIVGILFKIMHWPGLLVLLGLGYVGVIVTYGIRFILKKNKFRQDYLRLLLVISIFIYSYLTIIHLPTENLAIIPYFILLITCFDFSYSCFLNKELLNK